MESRLTRVGLWHAVVFVAKNPIVQGKGFVRFTIKLDSQNLWTTPLENSRGKVPNRSTV